MCAIRARSTRLRRRIVIIVQPIFDLLWCFAPCRLDDLDGGRLVARWLRQSGCVACAQLIKSSMRCVISAASGVSNAATGTRHANASSAPVTGDTGAHCSATTPSAVQAGSRSAWAARASHSRTRPALLKPSPSMRAISMQTRCVSRFCVSGSSAARAASQSRELDGDGRNRDRALDAVGRRCDASWRIRGSRSLGLSPARA